MTNKDFEFANRFALLWLRSKSYEQGENCRGLMGKGPVLMWPYFSQKVSLSVL